ncbi:MAG: two-component system sensor histidine kinase NtrB [Limisphaerales bacterium]
MKYRLDAFVLAIVGMFVLIAWTGHTSWQRSGELRERLTTVQLQSFQIADHLQQTIWELNNLVLRYGVYHDTNAWNRFQTRSKELDKWIDDERPILSTETERQVLDLIDARYDEYMAAAHDIETKIRSSPPTATPLVEFADFEKQSQRILNFGSHLAKAHLDSMGSFLADSQKSLTYLRVVLLISLALLLLSGGGLAVMVYRGLIAPLRLKLVESQALMERQEKLASLGLLAAGVAHEIRNPLTAIKAWLFLQQKHLLPGSPEHTDTQVIANEVTRLENIVKDVLLLARPSEPRLTTVPADGPLRQVQALLQPQLEKANIRLAVQDSVSAPIKIDRQQIQQVLINLIQNAADSIGHDGEVTLRARLDNKRLADRVTDVVILEVADTGKGIPPEVEKRLFDPFFTTKDAGTGLGLSIAARIVEKHGGALQYQTQPDHGTTFGIVLPRV